MAFRKDFIWGAATSAYQIEGAVHEDGRGLSVWDRFSHTPNKVFDGHTGDVACDHYHRLEEDIDLIAALGIPSYRFSFSWPRILPDGTGRVNPRGIAFYDRLIDGLLRHGIRPFATLFHWDYPLELFRRGGWENPDSPRWFEEYAALCARHFGDRVKDFIPLNEPACFIGMGHVTGEHAPGLMVPPDASIVMAHHALLANGLAIRAIREAAPDARVGYSPDFNPMMPESEDPGDIQAARLAYFHVPEDPMRWHRNSAWWCDPVMLGSYPAQGLKIYERWLPRSWERDMPLIHQRLDFYGQNIYQGHRVRAADHARGFEITAHPPGIAKGANDWPVTPDCLYWAARFLYERYRTPIIITENGMADTDALSLNGRVHDPARRNYMQRYLLALKRAAEEGADIAGYFYWSLFDNFEWARGYSDRFGLVYVDFQTLKRTPKDSAWWYKEVIAQNGENLHRA